MTEKRFKADNYYFEIWDNDEFLLSFDQTVDLLNQLNDENIQLKQDNKRLLSDYTNVCSENVALKEEKKEIAYYHKRQIDDKIEYKIRVKKVLKRYYDDYTQMAVDLRNDKYANGVCHDVIEVLCEIADKLGVKIND